MKIYSISSQSLTTHSSSGILKRGISEKNYQQEAALIESPHSYSAQLYCYSDTTLKDSQIACAYMNAQAINFGYSSILKTLFKEGKMPSVTKGIYGYDIDNSTVSLEHLKPHSLGGKNTLSNYALANMRANSQRGNKPLPYFLNNEMLENYLAQFNFEIEGVFSGYKYQRMIRNTCRELGVGELLRTSGKEILEMPAKTEEAKILNINYGSMKDVIANLDSVDINALPKKMLKSLRGRGILVK